MNAWPPQASYPCGNWLVAVKCVNHVYTDTLEITENFVVPIPGLVWHHMFTPWSTPTNKTSATEYRKNDHSWKDDVDNRRVERLLQVSSHRLRWSMLRLTRSHARKSLLKFLRFLPQHPGLQTLTKRNKKENSMFLLSALCLILCCSWAVGCQQQVRCARKYITNRSS